MKEIPLSRGMVALVDDEDFDWLSQWKWSALKAGRGGFYAMRAVWDGCRNRYILMHRQIMDVKRGVNIDHVNLNGLDNRRSNLRSCDQAKNSLNQIGHRDKKTSKYKGVYQTHGRRQFFASFRGKHIGSFLSEDEAARAYDRVAFAFDPVFSRLNFPMEA